MVSPCSTVSAQGDCLPFFLGGVPYIKLVGGRHPERENLFTSRTGSAVFNQVFANEIINTWPHHSLNNSLIYSVQSVEAPAEIFDFVAGLMQSVPKKQNIVKAYL